MEQLRCVVERITYQNPQNGYSVIKCRAKGYSDLVTVVGSMPDVHVGSVLQLGGSWRVDAKYGRQFSMKTSEETLPATVFGIEKYLGSGLIRGIGPKFAKKILVLVGTKKALGYTVRNVTVTKRNTMLKERLQKALSIFQAK